MILLVKFFQLFFTFLSSMPSGPDGPIYLIIKKLKSKEEGNKELKGKFHGKMERTHKWVTISTPYAKTQNNCPRISNI